MTTKKEKRKLFLYCIALAVALAFSSLGNAQAATAAVAESTPQTEETGGDKTQPGDSATEVAVTEVEVTGTKDGPVARDANIGVLGDKDLMDTPFNVTSYTAETIEDQQADTLHDVLVNDPSVRYATSSGHNNENYMIRGLDVNYEHLYFNGMQGLAPHYQVPVEFLERVEVLKGPSSFLYGGVNTSVGGAINLVPKRAGEEDITNFTTSYASSSHWGGHLDIGRRFGENKEWGVRFNGVYADGETATDDQSGERMLGALAVDYRSDKWRFSLDAYRSEVTNDNGAVSMYYLNNGYVKAPDGSTNMYRGTSATMENTGVLLKGEYDIRDNLTAYFGIGTLSANATGFINGNHVQLQSDDGTAKLRNIFKQNFWTENTSSELGLRGTYQTGGVKHQFVLGANLMDADYSNAFANYFPTINSWSILTNIDNPISVADYYDSVTQPAKGNKTRVTELSSFLMADTLSFNEEKVQLTLGVRRQEIDETTYKYSSNLQTGEPTSITNYDSDATTPMVGLIVKPWDESVSLYANYIEALSPGTVVSSSYVNYGELLEAYKTKQHEIGVKWDKGKITNTLSFFQIEKPNGITTTTSGGNYYSYDGEQRNRGIEWNIFGSIAKDLRLLGGIAYTKAEIVRTSTSASANEGNTSFGVPEWTANIGAEWDTPWVQDLALSLQAIYTSSQYIDNANTIKIPSWMRYDIGARYKSVISTIPVTYRLSVINLFDEHYWAGCFNEYYATLGTPRTVKLSATMKF
ncbi:iron complex outermembrane receptor protein [Hydrogenispora ethanolica]|uniref:Iron complex outermembrane receptor protein n=1 Tax=Hydrogenispora ethanolica TaxID=1082276 RepID=A0A4V2QF62_HYDET|nr:TonB-dependent siderophore receptor [Hydrogenispora ethanolica]TCL70687.1 iron complex outermembrane receptor protein [Hydrogenispora ethanolica]